MPTDIEAFTPELRNLLRRRRRLRRDTFFQFRQLGRAEVQVHAAQEMVAAQFALEDQACAVGGEDQIGYVDLADGGSQVEAIGFEGAGFAVETGGARFRRGRGDWQ